MPSEKTRAYIYRVLVALGTVAVFYGVISSEEAVVLGAAAATILGTGLAALNTSTK